MPAAVLLSRLRALDASIPGPRPFRRKESHPVTALDHPTITLLAGAWPGSLFTGAWTPAPADAAAVAPATGEELGRVGIAGAAEVAASARRAAAAQREWAATSFEERAAVLRRAGALFEAHAAEIEDWIVRESGGIPPKAQLETHIAAQECYEAAALPSHPIGEILATG